MKNSTIELIDKIGKDLQSGACELSLKAINVFGQILSDSENNDVNDARNQLSQAAKLLIKSQPGMAPIFNLSNEILNSTALAKNINELKSIGETTLTQFENDLCRNAQSIAEHTASFIPTGELIFAYSFSSTVITALLNARSKGKYFRVASTEARPSFEGRKLAKALSDGDIEVMHTFDLALGLVLPNCSVAFMGADCVGLPGVVNKVGSWLLAIACREYSIPLYVLCDTAKFVSEERLFEFEKHVRPGSELWPEYKEFNNNLKILNHQYELVSLNLITGFITENGLIQSNDLKNHIPTKNINEAIQLEEAFL